MHYYRALLLLYPKSFRDEYGGEMRSDFARRRGDAAGPLSAAWLYASALFEVLFNAAAVHLDILRQDLRYTVRSLGRAPGFAFTAIAVTALGVGANTAAFTVADFVLIRPLPYADANRLVKLWETQVPGHLGRNEVSPPNYRDWKTASSWESMGAFALGSTNLVGQGEPQRVETTAVTADLLPLLGAQPLLGRFFTAAEEKEGAGRTVVLSHGLWQAQFGGESGILGRTVTLDGAPHVVIGVMPRGFHFPSRAVQLWRPLTMGKEDYEDRNNNFLQVVGKLKRGVSLADASAEMDVICSRLEKQFPKELERVGAQVIGLRDELSAQSRLLLIALSGAALCVLLIACANLANLLLARGLVRQREISVRSALGAGRERLVRQLVTESLVLAALGGMCGILVAFAAVPLLSSLVPETLPIAQAPGIDPRILVFAAVLTALTGTGFGVVPALRASRKVDLEALRDGARAGGGRRQRLRSALVVAEVMATVVLLVSAGLLMRALWRLQGTDPGFRPEGVLTLRTTLPWPKYEKNASRESFYAKVLGEVRTLPGVSSAGYITGLPMAMPGGIFSVFLEGAPKTRANQYSVGMRFATPGFFSTLGIPLLRGRDVADSDRLSGLKVAVVSESLARRAWPGRDAVGRRIEIANEMRTVVGIVGDVRMRGPERTSEPQVYLAYNQQKDNDYIAYPPKELVVKTSGEPFALVPALRRIIHAADPDQPISNVRTMSDIVGEQTASRAVQVRILGAFAAVAFLLAGVGIHGLLSYAVSSRKQEIGVRLALGAEPRDIVRMLMRQGVRLALAGVVPGALVAYAAGRSMEALLAGVKPADPETFLAAITLCVVMTLVGSLVPVLRAVRIEPATVMRTD